MVSRELPIFLGGITGSSNGRVGMSMGGREAGPEEGRGETGGDSERWAVVQPVSPSLLRAFVRPTLSLYSSDASTDGIHTSATLIRVTT